MSVESVAHVLHNSKATGTAKVIIIGIANHDGDGGSWPNVETLAKYANVSKRNASAAIRRLEEMGEIVVHRNAGGTYHTPADRRPNLYEITVETRPGSGVSESTPRDVDGVSESTERGVDIDRHGVSLASPEPSFNHPLRNYPPNPPPSAGGSICSKHPEPAANCRGCGTTNRQLEDKARKAAAEIARARQAAEIEADRQRKAAALSSTAPVVAQLVDQTRTTIARSKQLSGSRP